ncbi:MULTISPECIES: HipA domain-containing protein [Mesorhizobium]|uniref:Serine/threonine-protein kinase HipA n=1 Tax=Rhizobium loti TaxID=381 RepID=A0A8E2WG13_RHILI|nr:MULTISPECIES: HipA domain-containing protein [Mesorhizobium]PWJ93764.1 serine/threonine-protein kinase HipA [Mesorhizobium loti]QKC82142.1 type II toxin-antitoxin system HipA family toxin [Mesorhizobium sp. NZP2077]QKD15610.1 type II toxin-antitoxin system HipA family toxin [Mesorhizobium sp. NZP2077]
MKLTIETFWKGEWRQSAFLEIDDENHGYRGQSVVEYDVDYFMEHAAADRNAHGDVTDARALSVRYPVDLENRYLPTWPPFLLDLMPQGHARRKLAEHMKIDVESRSSDLPLLIRAAGNPVGNIRIREAAAAEQDRLANVTRVGVTENDILGRSDLFIEVVDRFGLLASGSSGLQGEWPKVALTLAHDGLYYPDAFVRDDEAVGHFIVKLLRSKDERDRLILQAEAGYSALAREIGLNVYKPSVYAEGVLIIPRFDREVRHDATVVRVGQESMVSAIGVADFGHLASHEDYIDVLKLYSNDPYMDIVEYVKRDIANRAFGNPDNHGRNTAMSKGPNGGATLAPLFDFAPMQLATEGIVKSTRWASMRDTHRDTSPDWAEVCRGIFPDNQENANRLLGDICGFAERLPEWRNRAAEFNIPQEVIDLAMIRCDEVASNVLAASSDEITAPAT